MIEKTDFWFSSAGQNRRLHIYLPDDYYESEERYPVMYMFDGHNLFYDSDATYGKSWGMKDFLDHWDKKSLSSAWNVRTRETTVCANTARITGIPLPAPFTARDSKQWIGSSMK